uniref:Secreted protein n=1 Tax=Angiostrongylus cantonensis TaxID=6313 RepID=A0A0K0D585_ANGCA
MYEYWALLVLLNSVTAQFFGVFNTRQRPSQIEAIGDQFGVRDAIGAWSRVLRNVATQTKTRHALSMELLELRIAINGLARHGKLGQPLTLLAPF